MTHHDAGSGTLDPVLPLRFRLAWLGRRVWRRFRAEHPAFAVGQRVVFNADIRWDIRFDPQHLPTVPAGTEGIIGAITELPYAGGTGYVVDLVTDGGMNGRYWTLVFAADLRRA